MLFLFRACYGVLRFVMENGAKGCEVCRQLLILVVLTFILLLGVWFLMFFARKQVIVSGKLRAQRAKSMKFKDGYMISSGQPVKEYIDSAVRHVLLRQVSLTKFVLFIVYSAALSLAKSLCITFFELLPVHFFLYSDSVSYQNIKLSYRGCLVSRSRSCLIGILRERSAPPSPYLIWLLSTLPRRKMNTSGHRWWQLILSSQWLN